MEGGCLDREGKLTIYGHTGEGNIQLQQMGHIFNIINFI